MNIFENMAAALDQRAAEARTGISRLEAAAVDEFEIQLRTLTSSEEERASVRRMAVQLLMLGVREAELEPMVRNWRVMVPRVDYELEKLKHNISSIQGTMRPPEEQVHS